MTAREAAGLLPREGTKPRAAGERLAASYVNFYIANGGIVMPLLDARTDPAAARALKRLFPGPARGRGAGARNPARRRQYPLHYPAGAARNANPITVCPLSPGPRARHELLSALMRSLRPQILMLAALLLAAPLHRAAAGRPVPHAAVVAPERFIVKLRMAPATGSPERVQAIAAHAGPARAGHAAHLCRHARAAGGPRRGVGRADPGAPARGPAGGVRRA